MLEWYSLTRRFSVLRTSSGSPIALDELKSKFAEQRARGSHNQVSEEEEDMILEALGRLHARNSRSRGRNSGEETDGEHSHQYMSSKFGAGYPGSQAAGPRQSVRSTATIGSSVLHTATSTSSLSSTKGSNVSRRMSNNLFGSGKLRDQVYLRSAGNTRRSGRDRNISSVTPSDSSMSTIASVSARADQNVSVYSDSLRPSTPDGSTYTVSVPSSPNNDKVFERQRSRGSISGESRSEYGAATKTFSTRASLALDDAIRELEEEGDDEIVMERSPIAHVSNGNLSTPATTTLGRNSPLISPVEYEAVTAISPDDQAVQGDAQRASPFPRSRTTSPTPRLPGYLPGMPRPLTPRDTTFDADDLTPSTTPRATSPRLPGGNPLSPVITQSITSSIYRSNSTASTSHQSTSQTATPTIPSTPPLFFNRSTNGRFTPEDRQRNGSSSPTTTESPDSPSQARRRPFSPLSSPTYQSLAGVPARPVTPSNVTWNTSSSPASGKAVGRNGSVSGHSRNASTTSITEVTTDSLERARSMSRSHRSPTFPDSSWIDLGLNGDGTDSEYRPSSAMSGTDLGSPVQMSNRPLRSPTPTHNRQKSPTAAGFPEYITTNGESASRRSSKQNHHSSFSLGSSHALLLSPIANSSRSSMESVGSSYHSWDEDHKKDRLFDLVSSLDPQHTDWHDVSAVDKSNVSTPGTSPYDDVDIEDVVRRQTGLTKGDFVAVQDKLINAAMAKATTPDGRNRASSLRKRRPSTSQSNYSFTGTDNRVASPAPQPQAAITASTSKAAEQKSKASALLDSVVDSIESPRANSSPMLSAENALPDDHQPVDQPLSSPGRRHRALADVLFGAEEDEPSDQWFQSLR
ncbi:uncharacterized protein FIBRA_05842 [Fibroporia radiculosa]|uniref:Uncharacterized protein n=1 Tax=Fibroporia radiculosa TaxID=599839 RepID=J4IAY0_9APHY|nr:uncharacterized protein FIBRA_05842 [Fibroporia radiculosa]CCM03696.1 predicted protein [Fibroporia radiculosa]